MNLFNSEDDIDFSEFDLDEREIAARRLLMYSDKALDVGLPIDHLFVNHPGFSEALAGLDRIFQLATRVDMPHGMGVFGPTGTGKTSLLKYFQRSLPNSSLFTPGLGAVYVRIPMRVTAPYLVGALLRIYGYPFRRVTKEAMEQRITILLEAIRQKGTRVLIFDEANNLAPEGAKRRTIGGDGTSPTDLIRQLMDDAHLGVVFSGTGTLDDISELDEALGSRVVGRFKLELFNYDMSWVRLIKGFVQQTTEFDISILLAPDVSQKLHQLTEGRLRNLKRLITEMVLVAVDDGAQGVELKHICRAYNMVYGVAAQKRNPFEVVPA